MVFKSDYILRATRYAVIDIFDFKVEVPKRSFGTATLKPYKTVKTHQKVTTQESILASILGKT